MIQKDTPRIKLNKTPLIEVSILDLSKVLMCDFHYNYIKNKYDVKVEL